MASLVLLDVGRQHFSVPKIRSNSSPKSTRKQQKSIPNRPQIHPKSIPGGQGGARRLPEAPRRIPKAAQDPPKVTRGRPKGSPGRPLSHPKSPQGWPKGARRFQKGTKIDPRMLQGPFRTRTSPEKCDGRCYGLEFIQFLLISLPETVTESSANLVWNPRRNRPRRKRRMHV